MDRSINGGDHDLATTSRADAGRASARIAGIGAAFGQTYPSRPVRFVVPFPAGGSTDVGARMIGEYLSRAFGQQVFVENKSGANGTIGVAEAAREPAVRLYHSVDPRLGREQSPRVQSQRPSDRESAAMTTSRSADRARRGHLARRQFDAELIALAKQKPGLRYATGSGLGSPQHMAVQWFAKIAGIKLEQIPYRGGGRPSTICSADM